MQKKQAGHQKADPGAGERSFKKVKASIRNCAEALSAYHIFLLFFLLLLDFSPSAAIDVRPAREGSEKILIQRGPEQITVFNVEVVSDRKALQQGLSGRSSMPDDHGMLFILDSSAEYSFWMKGMKLPVDILFFAEDKSLTGVLPKLMPCKECQTYKAPANTAFALEINAGLAEVLGFRTGDRFVYENK
jgi:hypothetical protein